MKSFTVSLKDRTGQEGVWSIVLFWTGALKTGEWEGDDEADGFQNSIFWIITIIITIPWR